MNKVEIPITAENLAYDLTLAYLKYSPIKPDVNVFKKWYLEFLEQIEKDEDLVLQKLWRPNTKEKK